MKILKYAIFLIFIISCNKQSEFERCNEFSNTYKSYAISNYKDFDGYAQLNYKIKKELTIILVKTNELCEQQEKIIFSKITSKVNDTIFIDDDSISALYFIKDDDSIIDIYNPIISHKFHNWLLIEKINKDSTEIFGQFQIGFKRKYPEREIWDDLNRPDTLYFTQGKFYAKYISD